MNWSEAAVFGYFSLALYRLASLPGHYLFILVVVLLAIPYTTAHLLQGWLVKRLRARPLRLAPLGRVEAALSIIAPLALAYFLLEWIVRTIRTWLLHRRQGKTAATADSPGLGHRGFYMPSIRVPTLGPTFLLAGVIISVFYWSGRLVDPLLARASGLSAGHSFWQLLFLGRRPEFAWLSPLEEQPRVTLVLSLVFWLVVWWSAGNLLRGIRYRSLLQRNHGDIPQPRVEAQEPRWATWFGVVDLIQPGRSYRRWASWMLSTIIVLLLLAYSTLDRNIGGVSPSALALATVVTLSWVLHLRLHGFATQHETEVDGQRDSTTKRPAGWPEVAAELGRLYGCAAPIPLFERAVAPLPLSAPAGQASTVSPLVVELLAGADQESTPRLNTLQKRVLECISLLGFVQLPAPVEGDELILTGFGAQQIEDRSGLVERHQIVLAPEGSGKTTLAILAAANHALTHARATLIVTRSENQAELLTAHIRATVEPSTMRWNLRLRQLGRDFASDLSRDIIPDLVVVSLEQLVTGLLDNHEVYIPFLRHVGLVVVDDVESYAGAVEIHAQLAFRRLQLLFRQLSDVEYLGDENAPLMLVLGVDSMKQTASWAQSLCGIQASIHTFSDQHSTASVSEGDSPPCQQQLGYRFSDLRTDSGRPLTAAEVVGVCEALRVPWLYRPAGDGRRHAGRGPLLLNQEPSHACATPGDACVVLLEGRWSEVRRELRRLRWAGADSGRKEVCFLTVVGCEEQQACETLDPAFGLAPGDEREELTDLSEQLITLPLPIVRPPSTLAVQSHLLSDLLQQWIEVKDLVDTFGGTVVQSLRRLNRQGMLFIEERCDVKPERKEYEAKVYLRATAASLQDETAGEAGKGIIELAQYDKVRQVELVSPQAVRVRNRSDHTQLGWVEARSASAVYYPGRILEDARGRFVVVSRRDEGELIADVEVEPVLHADISSPRRRFEVDVDTAIELPSYPLFKLEPVLLGQDPVEVGLQPVTARLRMIGFYRLDRYSGEVQSREILRSPGSGSVASSILGGSLQTTALVLNPNPAKTSPGTPQLNFGEARLLCALLRYLLPMVYRDTRDHFEVALVIAGLTVETEQEPPRWDAPLQAQDRIFILDLQQGGNGIARAIFRDGLELLFRFCRHFLETVEGFSRLQRLYDHWGHADEILQDGRRGQNPETETVAAEHHRGANQVLTETEQEASDQETDDQDRTDRTEPPGHAPRCSPLVARRDGLLDWLASRLHPEPQPRSRPRPEPTAPESESADNSEEVR